MVADLVPGCFLDENVSESMVADLRGLGQDVVSTTGLGRKGASDVAQLVFAARSGRVLITHNARHFAMLHEAWGAFAALWGVSPAPSHPGIVCVPDAGQYPIADSARLVDALLRSGERVAGRIRAWDLRRGWYEPVP